MVDAESSSKVELVKTFAETSSGIGDDLVNSFMFDSFFFDEFPWS